MRTAPLITPPPGRAAAVPPAATAAPPGVAPGAPAESLAQPLPSAPPILPMDREFILRNQITERYIAGRLPPRGAQDFERYCRENPDLIDQLGLAERVHAGLRLLEAGGVAAPWEEKPRRWWEKLPALISVAAAALVATIFALLFAARLSARDATIASLQKHLIEQPLDPATSTRTVRLIPSRTAPSQHPAVVVGSGEAQMADLKIDMSWSNYTAFRVTLDRQDQGRVAVMNYMLRDSNGDLRLALNSSALGPGTYQFAIEGLTIRGDAVAQAWVTIGIAH
jgi:hypothetical protein